MISRDRAREILEQALRLSRADEAEAHLAGSIQHLTRFAGNTIHQNVSQRSLSISLRAVFGRRSGRASTNRLDEAGLRAVVAAAEAIARNSPEDPTLLPVVGPQEYAERHHFDAETAGCGAKARARTAGIAIEAAMAAGLSATGYACTGESISVVATHRGAFAFYRRSTAGFSTTMTGADSTGWVEASDPALAKLDVRALTATAVDKAKAGAQPKSCRAGRYTVILEPSAAYDLIASLGDGFGALQVLEKQSFLTDRLGTRLFGDNIDIWDDAHHALQDGAYMDGEAVPRRTVRLIERGVAKELVHDRDSALKFGVESTGHALLAPNPLGASPFNLVVGGGESTLEEMIRGTEKGILVTRFWYNRLVEPMPVLLTGMTRDGTFLVEGGKIRHGIKNLRYNQSVVEMLNRVVALGPAVRAGSNEGSTIVLPAMKVEGFRFQSAAGG